jgi:hypothetical protein
MGYFIKKRRKLYDGMIIKGHYNSSGRYTYMNRVKMLTKKIKDELFAEWDGYDYYDNEFIGNNISLGANHPDYPTVDHVIPMSTGFRENISPKFMASKKNLVITKNKLNQRKGNMLLVDFLMSL